MDRLAREVVALAVFLSVAQDPHAGSGDAQDLVRVDGAHVGELDEPAAPCIPYWRRRPEGTVPPDTEGVTVRIAGLSTPGKRPSTNMPMAIIAPEFPALTNASPSPALSRSKATLMDESFCFRARLGESCMSMEEAAVTTLTAAESYE